MDDSPPVIPIVVAAVLALAVLFALLSWLDAKRAKAWRAACASLGLTFVGLASAVLGRFSALRVLSRGRAHELYNASVGELNGFKVHLGEHRFRTGNGNASSTHHASMALFERSGMGLPHAYLRGRNPLLDDLGKWLGGQAIELADDPAFSQAFVLQGEDPEAVRRLFDPAARQWLLQQEGEGLIIETWEDVVLLMWERRLQPPQLPQAFGEALRFVSAWVGRVAGEASACRQPRSS